MCLSTKKEEKNVKDNTKKTTQEEIKKLVDNYNRVDETGKIMIFTYLSALADRAAVEKAG